MVRQPVPDLLVAILGVFVQVRGDVEHFHGAAQKHRQHLLE
jgi:hypothetical protein